MGAEALRAWLKSRKDSSACPPRQPGTVEKLYCAEYGYGEEHVLLLHGLGADHQYFISLLRDMNLRKYRYICPDLLGHGRSDAAPQLNYDVETHLFFLERDALCKMRSPQSAEAAFHLVGHGLGAVLALELAARHPERVLSLTLISLPYFDSDEQATSHYLSQVAGPLSGWKFLTRFVSGTGTDWIRGMADIVRPVNFVSESLKPDQLHAIVASFQECILRHRVDNAASALSKGAKFPVLILHGTEDPQVPRDRIESFFSRYGQSFRLDLFQGAGHDLCKNHAQDVARLITAAVFD
jgi:pimeloyl-ACP methyl ester carboxylesterase